MKNPLEDTIAGSARHRSKNDEHVDGPILEEDECKRLTFFLIAQENKNEAQPLNPEACKQNKKQKKT